MKINSIILKNMCSKLINALDTDASSTISESVELKVEDKVLSISIASDDYTVRTVEKIDNDEQFRAVVEADVFLKLINQITTEQVEFSIDGTTLVVKGNGEYKFAMIYEGDNIIDFPDLSIQNETTSFCIPDSILSSIVTYNSRELSKNTAVSPTQKMYYIDNKGCITFTTGACVNNFTLPEDVSFLLNKKIVKLFKLFGASDNITMSFGTDTISEIDVHKLALKSDTTEVISIINTDSDMINNVPKDLIRDMSDKDYPYSVNLSKRELLGIINRLGLFMSNNAYTQHYAYFEFGAKEVTIIDKNRHNTETLKYDGSELSITKPETVVLDLYDIKSALDGFKKDIFSISFGDHKAVVFKHSNISNIIPECEV